MTPDEKTVCQAKIWVVQQVLTPFEDMPPGLYFRTDDSLAQTAFDRGSGFNLATGQSLNFDSYFNAFFVGAWGKINFTEKLGLRVSLTGAARVDVYCMTAERSEKHLQTVEVAGSTAPQTVWFAGDAPPDDHLSPTRYWFVVTAHEATELDDIAYVSAAPPNQSVALSLGLCTFNRERALAQNLDRLFDFRHFLPELTDVFLVNQGAPMRDKGVLAAKSKIGADFVEQSNLGGCGGFTRTMLQATDRSATPSHHLLMDDDVVLDPRMIRRALDFLKFCPPDKVIGGSMLEMQHPELLWEAGAKIGAFWTINSLGSGLDLRRVASLNALADFPTPDYNAWWFCIIPTACIQEIGLPLPVFLHGDDIEYGCRLQRQGFETISPPGLAVWHETFAYKTRDWIFYYDFRNTLINSTLHTELEPPLDALVILGAVMTELLSHKYRAAEAMIAAVRDFLRGPNTLFLQDPDALHEALLSTLAKYDDNAEIPPHYPALTDNDGSLKPPTKRGAMTRLIVTRLAQLTLFDRSMEPVQFLNGDVPHPMMIRPGPFAVINAPDQSKYILYEPDRIALWRGVIKTVFWTMIYAMKTRSARKQWRDNAAAYSSANYWQNLFARAQR